MEQRNPDSTAHDHGAAHDHVVQFYSSDSVLADSAGGYLAAGLRAGESAVIIVTKGHKDLFLDALRRQGADEAGLARVTCLDAHETLDSFMSEGLPVWERFRDAVGPVLEDAERRGRVRAYGEMVDVLWQQGRLSAALQLEGHWNRLLERRRIPLFCAYRADPLDSEQMRSLRFALKTHSELLPTAAHLEAALVRALDEVLGEGRAEALRPLISGNMRSGARLPWAEAAAFWVSRNMPDVAERILHRGRMNLALASSGASA